MLELFWLTFLEGFCGTSTNSCNKCGERHNTLICHQKPNTKTTNAVQTKGKKKSDRKQPKQERSA